MTEQPTAEAAAANLIASAIAGEDISITPAPAAPPEQKTEAPAAPAAPEVPAEAPKAEEPQTPEEKYMAALAKKQSATQAPALDDTAKAALKAKGIEDLDAFLTEKATLAEQLNQFKTKAEQYDKVEETLKSLPVEIAEAIELARKGEDYTKALKPLSDGITLSKEAKAIDKFKLVDHYFPGKFSEEQKEAIRDGDEALKGAFDLYHEQAANKHNGLRGERMSISEQRAAEAKATQELFSKATAQAIAMAKADEATSVLLTPEIIGSFEKGHLIDSTFYNADGTPKPESLALIAKALNHDAIVARAMKGAAASAAIEGELRARERMPERPAAGSGDVKQPIPTAPKGSDIEEFQKQAQELIGAALMG